MKLGYEQYLEKVKACWLGKNIGGTLGAPIEGKRGAFDMDYYTHDLSWGVLPNDDLDLQLIFLLAAEKYGKNLRAEHLAEYWLYLIPVDWSEYGQGKNNLRMGFLPPVCGNLYNEFKNSCGCFIRSEIWACLHPGHPELAVKYAYEDGIIDHADEGVYGEIFCAAIESAAFVESDVNKLIEIGLSYIPETSAVAGAVRLAIDCYNRKLDWKESRKELLKAYPDTFGLMRNEDQEGLPKGELGFDAPVNVAIIVMSWLYGEGDFSKSICIAAGCGEDADCTAGTLASILGIIHGTKHFDEKWLQPIGDAIKTISIDLTKEFVIPDNVIELTDRVAKLMPVFMHGNYTIEDGKFVIECSDTLCEQPEKTSWFESKTFSSEIENSFMTLKRESIAFNIFVDLNTYELDADTPLEVSVKLESTLQQQQWITVKVLSADGSGIYKETFACLNQYTAGGSTANAKLTIPAETIPAGKRQLLVLAQCNGKISTVAVPLNIIKK